MRRSGLKVMGQLIGLVKPMIGYMIMAVLLGVAGHVAAIAIPTVGAYGLAEPTVISTVVIVLIICGISRGVFRYGEQMLNHYIAFKVLAKIRHQVFEKLRSLAPAKLETREKGNIIALITSDIELLEVFYAHTISPIAIAVINSVLMVVLLGTQHLLLGLVAGLSYILIGLAIPFASKGDGGIIGYHYRERVGKMNSLFLENIQGLRETVQFQFAKKRFEQFERCNEEVENCNEQLKIQEGKNRVLTDRAIFGVIVMMALICGWLLYQGKMEAKVVVVAFVAFISSFGPTVALSSLSNNLFHTIASGNRILDLLAEEPQLVEVSGKPNHEFGNVACQQVDFSYGDEDVLKEMSLMVDKGDIVGIYGKSGCGKSTLLKLLMRFFKPDGGTIKIGETSLEEINTTNLREMESYVTQETCLFNDSIRENIKIAKPTASDDEVIAAARRASVHEFIDSLPKGYDTTIGELGGRLSGGERQRIGLARALLYDAPLMLLDEPTSNLDSLNEGVILNSLKEEKKKRTIILVSHRKSTMGITDKIVIMN